MKITTKDMKVCALLESDRKLGLESSPEDLADYQAWREIQR